MQQLTSDGKQRIDDLSRRYGVSTDAVMTLLQALVNGSGTMAQFYHQELGGSGQWMQGGMTMVGDMFNHGLKAKVDGLCSELSNLLASQPFAPSQVNTGGSPVSLFVPSSGGSSGNWWPGDLGVPTASGSQNNVRYAYFAGARRLAVEVNGRVSVYDTLDHQISGISQQQGSGSSVTFTSQYGVVSVLNLPIISGDLHIQNTQPAAPIHNPPPQQAPRNASGQESDIFAAIERLADLKQKGILTEQEFTTKKAELLSRL